MMTTFEQFMNGGLAAWQRAACSTVDEILQVFKHLDALSNRTESGVTIPKKPRAPSVRVRKPRTPSPNCIRTTPSAGPHRWLPRQLARKPAPARLPRRASASRSWICSQ